jgi:hypothetical protein
LVSVDGTDYAIREPQPFHKKWFSHKMNGPGVRYEIAICIQTGVRVWTNGPYPCGSWPDLRIARYALVDAFDPGEYYIADGGYRDGASKSELLWEPLFTPDLSTFLIGITKLKLS